MRKAVWLLVAAIWVALGATYYVTKVVVGKQGDGTFVVSTGQRIDPGTISFEGRPMDLAIHPDGKFVAVATNRNVFLIDSTHVIDGSSAKLPAGVSYHGMAWNNDGTELFVSMSNGKIGRFSLSGTALTLVTSIDISKGAPRRDVVPGGMCFGPGGHLWVVEANGGQVLEIDPADNSVMRRIKVGNIPFDCRISADAKTLVVSNWAGREATAHEKEEGHTDDSDGVAVLVDKKGTSQVGSVSIIDLPSGEKTDIEVGIHPCGLALADGSVWVANAGSDSVSEIDLATKHAKRTVRVRWNDKMMFGSMPNSLAVSGQTLYLCNGGDNALCEVNLKSGKIEAFRPAGYYPVAVQVTPDGASAYVCNTKGNGSVAKTLEGKPGGVHDFQGTVSVIDLHADSKLVTAKAAEYGQWDRWKDLLKPNLPVYQGKIKHVLYIIKENKTYDSVFGDIKEGDGDAKICLYPENVTPNAHKLAREFTLFDNAYVVGTNSAEGHQWAIESLANDYIERFYGGYSRSYPYDGGDPMAYSSGGFIWDSVLDAGKTVRNYGEFCTEDSTKILPKGTKWIDAWKDRETKAGKVTVSSTVSVKRAKPFTHPAYPCWPISISDQYRADTFIADYKKLCADDKVPNLLLMSLPCDHGAGTDPDYPTVRAMVADNDFALGRIVEAVSNGPQWKDTAIIVMEDDGQGALDHIDGHRTVMLVISPYTKRGFVDSTMYSQLSVIKSITTMLGTKSLTRFDATAPPLTDCFADHLDLTPYQATANRVPLDEMNKPLKKTTGKERYWAEKSLSLDFGEVDSADWYWLNRINWAAAKGWDAPYPAQD